MGEGRKEERKEGREGGRKRGRRDIKDGVGSTFCGSTLHITRKYVDISDLIIIITAFFIVFESICAPLDLDCRTWLKKSAASLNVFVHSFILSSTTDPFDFQV